MKGRHISRLRGRRRGLRALAACAFGLAALAILQTRGGALAKDPPPQWLTEAASQPPLAYDPKVKAAVLLDERRVTFDETGRIRDVYRFAVRVLRYEGRSYAVARRLYRTDGGTVRELKAWVVRPTGPPTSYGKGDAIDVAVVNNDVYNEARYRVIDASNDVDVGSVFGFEASVEDRSFSGQFEWYFQGELPVRRSVFSIEAPSGWGVKSVTFNHAPVEPAVTGSTFTWELRDLPFIDEEPRRPPVASLAPRLAVSVVGASSGSRGPVFSFDSWPQVARWLDELGALSSESNAPIAAKAQALAAGASTELDRIRPIGRYVQDLNYISIQMGTARGGGYRPHPAAEVFAKSYGDCKDKANLMKTMLRAVGIESYLVAICARDPFYVREEWPTPLQFDHCILAVRVRSDSLPAIVKHPSLGSLLLFDPTDPDTPPGDLPEYEQGSNALLISRDHGGLMRVPVTAAEMNRVERRIEAELDSSGAVRAKIHEWSCGQRAVRERRLLRSQSRTDYKRTVENWIERGAGGAIVTRVAPKDDERGGTFELDVEFHAERFAQAMGARVLVFKPTFVERLDWLSLTAPKRQYPIVLDARVYRETSSTKLPRGFAVEELPSDVKLETPFGSYVTSFELQDGELRFTRSLELKATTVPVEQYEAVRGFFERVRTLEQTPVVLARL